MRKTRISNDKKVENKLYQFAFVFMPAICAKQRTSLEFPYRSEVTASVLQAMRRSRGNKETTQSRPCRFAVERKVIPFQYENMLIY